MGANIAGTIKLIAQIAGVAHELGEYAAPIVKGLTELRSKAPTTSTGQDLSPEHVQQQIDHALATAQSIEDKANRELGTRLDA